MIYIAISVQVSVCRARLPPDPVDPAEREGAPLRCDDSRAELLARLSSFSRRRVRTWVVCVVTCRGCVVLCCFVSCCLVLYMYCIVLYVCRILPCVALCVCIYLCNNVCM